MASRTSIRIFGSALVALAVMIPANTTAYSTPGAGGQVVTSASRQVAGQPENLGCSVSTRTWW